MPANLEIYDTTLSTTIPNLVSAGDAEEGEGISVFSFKIRNDGDATATAVRLFARCINGLYTGQQNGFGQEAVTEQWIQVDSGSGFTPIGGNFGNGDPGTNYVSLANISSGASSAQIDVKLVTPVGMSSYGQTRIEVGVSCKED